VVQLAASLRGLCESSRKVYAHLPATSASKIAQPRDHLTSLLAPQVTVYGRLATCCQDGQGGLLSNWMHGLRRASLLFMFCAALPAIFSRRGVRVLACCSFAHGHHWCLFAACAAPCHSWSSKQLLLLAQCGFLLVIITIHPVRAPVATGGVWNVIDYVVKCIISRKRISVT